MKNFLLASFMLIDADSNVGEVRKLTLELRTERETGTNVHVSVVSFLLCDIDMGNDTSANCFQGPPYETHQFRIQNNEEFIRVLNI